MGENIYKTCLIMDLHGIYENKSCNNNKKQPNYKNGQKIWIDTVTVIIYVDIWMANKHT